MVVAAALIDATGRILVQQRPEGKHMAGLWEFPGGKIESGESPEEALCRELDEELTVKVSPSDLKPFFFASEPLDGRHLLLLLYICEEWEGEPVALHASGMQWLRAGQLDELAMPPADRPLVEALVRYTDGMEGGAQPVK